jgi:acyl-coenzyme A synthetase/AMP-(fatty) acid ligase
MVEPATLSALIRHAAEQKPNGIAAVEGERSITYAAFHELVQRAAVWLNQAGVGRGSRIAIWLPNRLEWLVLLFAAARLGASVVAVEAIQSAAGKTMASFKVPARVWFLDRFPVTQSANGTKIQRGKLRDMALERLAKETASD